MKLQAQHKTNYPDQLLRQFATETLKAKRCSDQYMDALRVVLGNLSLADRIGLKVRLTIDVPFTGQSTMRTIISQFKEAGLTRPEVWRDDQGFPHVSQTYQGQMIISPDEVDEHDDPGMRTYVAIQRRQEAVDFQRKLSDLGVLEDDCPY
jgi:hypothetical protein